MSLNNTDQLFCRIVLQFGFVCYFLMIRLRLCIYGQESYRSDCAFVSASHQAKTSYFFEQGMIYDLYKTYIQML